MIPLQVPKNPVSSTSHTQENEPDARNSNAIAKNTRPSAHMHLKQIRNP